MLIKQHIKINSIALKSHRYLGSTARIIAKVPVKFQSNGTQRVHDAIIKSLWHQNNVATSFWLHNDVIIASRAPWVKYSRSFGTLQVRSYNKTSYWTLTLGHVSISNKTSYYKISQSFKALKFVNNNPWEKNWPPWLLTVSSRWIHGELTVTKMVTASRDWAATWAVIELWPSRDWAVIAVTELWPSRDWAVTSPWLLSCDLA